MDEAKSEEIRSQVRELLDGSMPARFLTRNDERVVVAIDEYLRVAEKGPLMSPEAFARHLCYTLDLPFQARTIAKAIRDRAAKRKQTEPSETY